MDNISVMNTGRDRKMPPHKFPVAKAGFEAAMQIIRVIYLD
jgi:hypothetical protein